MVIGLLIASVCLEVSGQSDPLRWSEKIGVGNPGARSGSAMAFDIVQGVMVLFGGDVHVGGGSLVPAPDNSTWSYDGTSWRQLTVTGTLPPARSKHTMAYDPELGRVLLFGGTDGGAQLWSFEFTGPATGAWHRHADLPSAGRKDHMMAYDGTRGRLVVVGGVKEGTSGVRIVDKTVYPATREVWEWDHLSWSRGPDAPEFRQGPYRDQFAVGGPAVGALGWHGGSRLLVLVANHGFPHSDPDHVYPPDNSIIYGTRYYYDGSSWQETNPQEFVPQFPGPPARYETEFAAFYGSSSMAYDSARDRLVHANGDIRTVEFNGQGWTFRFAGYYQPSGFPPQVVPEEWRPPSYPWGIGESGNLPYRAGAIIGYDAARGVTVQYGGRADGADFASDTWELDVNPMASTPFAVTTDLTTEPSQLCTGGRLVLTAEASGITAFHSPLRYHWLKDAVRIPGETNTIYSRSPLEVSDQGIYHFEVTDLSGRVLASRKKPVFVHAPPLITQPPFQRRAVPGEGFALTVSYVSTLPATLQWYRSGEILPGATRVDYVVKASTVDHAGLYTVVIDNGCHTTVSVPVWVEVGPRIVTNPSAPAGRSVFQPLPAMTISGDGVGKQTGTYGIAGDAGRYPDRVAPAPLGFVWRHEGVPLAGGAKYTITQPTPLTSSLVVNDPDHEDEGYYDCVVTDISGPAYSVTTPDTLLVLSPLAPPFLTVQNGGGPDRRTGAGMVFDSRRGKTVLFGGLAYGVNLRSGSRLEGGYPSDETWEWDGQVWVRRNPANRPPPMHDFGITYDPVRGRTIVFGGYKYPAPNYSLGTQVLSDEVWEWDGKDWTRVITTISPAARTTARMCYDSARREVLLIGGDRFSGAVSDIQKEAHKLWAWNGRLWLQRASLPTTDTYLYPQDTLSFDERRGRAAMFGVFGGSGYPVWEWDGADWHRIVPADGVSVLDRGNGNPTPFFDPVRRMLGIPIVGNNFEEFGFISSAPFVAYWNGSKFIRGEGDVIDELSGKPFTDFEKVPQPGQGDLTAFDTARRCLVWWDMPKFIVGELAATREMHFSAKVKPVHFPVQVVFAPDQDIQLRVVSAGRRPLIYQWFKDGETIFDTAHVTGADKSALNINDVTSADEGNYSVRISNIYSQVRTGTVRLTLQSDGVGVVVQGSGLVLSWPGATGILETSPNPGGPWTELYGVVPPYSVGTDDDHDFYRVRYP